MTAALVLTERFRRNQRAFMRSLKAGSSKELAEAAASKSKEHKDIAG